MATVAAASTAAIVAAGMAGVAVTAGVADIGVIPDTDGDGGWALALGGRIGGDGDTPMRMTTAPGGTLLIPTIIPTIVPLAIHVLITGTAIPRPQIPGLRLTQTDPRGLGDPPCREALSTRTTRPAIGPIMNRVLASSPLTG